VVQAVSLFGQPKGRAFDIGAGSLSNTRYLLSAGFEVDAIDPDPHTLTLAAQLDDPRLSFQCADVRDVVIEQRSYDVIVATRVLHLLPRHDLDTLVDGLVRAVADGGLLCATFLGAHDSWARTPWRATILRWDEVFALTSGLEVVRQDERESDGLTVFGEYKHWHTLQCVLRKPRDGGLST
jgi:trans-aconitate methyltransferase